MEKIECVVLYDAKPMITMTGATKYTKVDGNIIKSDCFSDYADLGLFTSKIDAFTAIEVYKKVLKVAKIDGVKPTEEYSITRKIFPEDEMSEHYYNNVQEFINDNLMIAKCKKQIGKDKFNKILVDLGVKMNDQQDRILERMVSDYVLQSKKLEDNNIERQTVEDYKNNIKFLQDLRAGKI